MGERTSASFVSTPPLTTFSFIRCCSVRVTTLLPVLIATTRAATRTAQCLAEQLDDTFGAPPAPLPSQGVHFLHAFAR